MAGIYDFKIEQGATLEIPILWKDGNGDPVDLSGSTARLTVKRGNTELFELASGDGLTLGLDTLPDGTEYNILISMPDEETEALDFTLARHFLDIVFPSGYKKRLLKGAVILTPEDSDA